MGLTASPVAHVERTYLDTVDWRLFLRGEVLVDEQDNDAGRVLVLQTRSSERSDLRVPAASRPREASELPPSLRQRVGRLVSPRALIDVGREHVDVWPLRLLDDDGKTVVHVDVERVDRERGPNLVRVQVRAVRGYEREARRLRAAFDRQADLEAADDPMIVAARLGGAEPGVGLGPPPLRFDTSGTGTRALANVFEHLLAAVTAYEDGVCRQVDTELLHEFRIAVRRTRSTIRLAKSRLSVDITHVWDPDWAWLAETTSTPRDLDVLLFEIEAARDTATPEAKAGLDELGERIVGRRRTAQRTLERALAGDRYGTLKRGWRVAILELAQGASDDDTGQEELAGDLIAKAKKQLLRRAETVDSDSEASVVHGVRKRAKHLRYALELFGPLLPRGQVKTAVTTTKRLQADLGRFQDNDVHRRLIAKLVDPGHDLSPDAAAAGRLMIERFDEQLGLARRDLAKQLRRFREGMSDRRP